MSDSQSSDDYASARHRALGFLARREHAAAELRFKLSRGSAAAHYDLAVIQQVVDDLAKEGLQSDGRFAEMLVRHRHEQGHGPLKVRAELGRWDVSIERAASYPDLDWVDACRRAVIKRFGEALPDDRSSRAKQQRYLSGRGFDGEQIRSALNALTENQR